MSGGGETVCFSLMSPSVGHKGHAVTVSSQIHVHPSVPLRTIRAMVVYLR